MRSAPDAASELDRHYRLLLLLLLLEQRQLEAKSPEVILHASRAAKTSAVHTPEGLLLTRDPRARGQSTPQIRGRSYMTSRI
ncbi:unnamed protein product [Lampetra planeri]